MIILFYTSIKKNGSETMDFTKAMNIPANAVLPFNPMRPQLALGSAEYVAIEVIISKLFRRLIGAAPKSWKDLIFIHGVSLSYMGGAQGFANPPGKYEAGVVENLKDGVKGIPAILLGMYTVDTCYRGFHVPKWSMADILVSAASKTVSRPIFGMLYPLIKGQATDPLDVANEMTRNQQSKSTLFRKS